MWPRWLRILLTLWTAYDSNKRFSKPNILWITIVSLFGPLLIPFYLSLRPKLPNENNNNGFLWELFWNFEKLLTMIFGLSSIAVFLENWIESENKELPLVKRSEIKAGSILTLFIILVIITLERKIVEFIKSDILNS